jgi:hypothetical protein
VRSGTVRRIAERRQRSRSAFWSTTLLLCGVHVVCQAKTPSTWAEVEASHLITKSEDNEHSDAPPAALLPDFQAIDRDAITNIPRAPTLLSSDSPRRIARVKGPLNSLPRRYNRSGNLIRIELAEGKIYHACPREFRAGRPGIGADRSLRSARDRASRLHQVKRRSSRKAQSGER